MATGIAFSVVRDIVTSGFSAEADPNSTAPAASKIFSVPDRVPDAADGRPRGSSWAFTYLNASNVYQAGGTVTATLWLKDPQTGLFLAYRTITTGAQVTMSTDPVVGDLFAQVTALGSVPGGATKLRVLAAGRSSV